MFTLILILHISLLSMSIGISSYSLFAALRGHEVGKKIIATNTTITGVGIVSGAVLLLSAPLSSKCVVLLAYLVAFTSLQLFVTKRNQTLHASSEL